MAAHESTIEVDPALYECGESDYSSSGYDTNTQSLSSSINTYIFENGRRYHSYFGPDKNLQPTDETEQDRLDLQHEILLMLLDGELHKSPLKNPQRILDIGTGTGIWAIDMADKYPSAEIIGMDLSPIQPNWVPPNCKFEVDDAEQPWVYKHNSFDFIHARNLAQSITGWPKLMAEMYRATIPGGYVELAELGGELFSDDNTLHPAMVRIFTLLNKEALPKIGRIPATAELLVSRLEDAGFVDVQLFKYKHIFGPWPKDSKQKRIGAMNLLNMSTGIEAYVLAAAVRIVGLEPEVAKKICDDAFSALKNKHHHSYCLYYVAYARKPE